MCKAMQDKPWPEIQQSFLDAYNYRPSRAESLFHIAQIYRQKFNMPVLGFMFAKAAMDIPFPANDILFIPDAIYKWAILDEVSSTAFYAGYPLVGYDATIRLLQSGNVPAEHLERIQNNLKSYEQAIEQLRTKGIIPKEQVPELITKKKKKHK